MDERREGLERRAAGEAARRAVETGRALTGVTVTAQEPRPIVGEGGRDGQSMPLAALLRKRLDAGNDWP